MQCWQRYLPTFYNPKPGNKKLAEFAFLAMLGSMNKPRTLHKVWNNQDIEKQKT
jgi:hypothetical protein